MDLEDFRTRVMGTIFGGNSGADEQALVDGWVNEGVVDVLMRTHCFVDEGSFVTVSGTDDYHVSQDILAMNEVTMPYQSQTYVLKRKSPQEIMLLRQYNVSETNVAWVYALQGADTFMLYPSPTGETVTFWFVPKPTPMTLTTHDPSVDTYGGIASEYHSVIENYALWRTANYDDNKRAEIFLRDYEMGLRRIKKSMIRKGGRTLSPALLMKGRRRVLSSDPSYDWSYL